MALHRQKSYIRQGHAQVLMRRIYLRARWRRLTGLSMPAGDVTGRGPDLLRPASTMGKDYDYAV